MRIRAFDEDAVQSASGVHLAPGPVRKLGVVLEPEEPWEYDAVMTFASSIVPLPGGGWRMYYSVFGWSPRALGIAVAESQDGLHWERRPLGQMSYDGRDTNRLLIEGLPLDAHIVQPQVLRLPDGRWLMYCWWHAQEQGCVRYVLSESEDGLRWRVRDPERPTIYHPADLELGGMRWLAGLTGPVEGARFADRRKRPFMTAKRLRSNDATHVYYVPDRDRFEMYSVWLLPNDPQTHRSVPHDNVPDALRVIHRRISDDGIEWSDPELIITPDENDPLDQQFYYLSVHREADWLVGFLGHYRCWAQTVDIELCFSRDGRQWRRPLRGGYVARDPLPRRGCMSAYAPNALIDAGDSWLMLYTAGNEKHNHELPPGVTKAWRGVMAAAIPKGRFACLAAGDRAVGRITWKPFILTRDAVRVDARVRGCLRAELLDPYGRPLPGYELDRCIPLSGDRSDHTLVWEGGKTTAPYRYDAVTLRIEIVDGELFGVSV